MQRSERLGAGPETGLTVHTRAKQCSAVCRQVRFRSRYVTSSTLPRVGGTKRGNPEMGNEETEMECKPSARKNE